MIDIIVRCSQKRRYVKVVLQGLVLTLIVIGSSVACAGHNETVDVHDFHPPGRQAWGKPASTLMPEELDELAILRAESLAGDRTHVDTLRKYLDHKHPTYRIVATHALARLGDTSIIGSVNAQATLYQTSWEAAERTVWKARAVAEAAVKDIADPQAKVDAMTKRIFEELKSTPDQVNASVTNPPKLDGSVSETFVLRELADIVYRGDSQRFLATPEFTALKWDAEPLAALKIKYAKLSRAERIAGLIDELAGQKVITKFQNAQVQLLLDEGLPASDAAATKLLEMEKSSKDYDENGFTCLLKVISCQADNRYNELFARIEKNYTGPLQLIGHLTGKRVTVYEEF